MHQRHGFANLVGLACGEHDALDAFFQDGKGEAGLLRTRHFQHQATPPRQQIFQRDYGPVRGAQHDSLLEVGGGGTLFVGLAIDVDPEDVAVGNQVAVGSDDGEGAEFAQARRLARREDDGIHAGLQGRDRQLLIPRVHPHPNPLHAQLLDFFGTEVPKSALCPFRFVANYSLALPGDSRLAAAYRRATIQYPSPRPAKL